MTFRPRAARARAEPAGRSWHETSDLLVAVVPLALTVLLLLGGFIPILRTLSDPNTTWTGFAYQALTNRMYTYLLAVQRADTPESTVIRLRERALSSLENPAEYADLALVERLGHARLSRAAELFRAADQGLTPATRQARLALAAQEVTQLNEQAHERIHEVQLQHAYELAKLRLVLLLAAALSGLLSAALIWRSLRLWRAERQRLTGQRELLSLASHELRRPLHSLLIATDLLRNAQTPEERGRYLSVVEDCAEQLASRADLEHLDTMYGSVHLDWQQLDLARLLLEFRGPRTEVQLPETALTVQGDPARLRQIIENLHENALLYSAGPVILSLHSLDSSAEVWVQDSGPGIRPEDAERLFLPGERGSVQATPGHSGRELTVGQGLASGQGLGLTVARRLAQAHGAELGISAAPGGGTRMVLRLHASPGMQAALTPEHTASGQPASERLASGPGTPASSPEAAGVRTGERGGAAAVLSLFGPQREP